MLPPAERIAFVLHDMFAVPFDQIAPVIGRSEAATRPVARRARRRVRGAEPPDRDLARQRQVVDAFFAAARGGDFDALVAVLDPDVVLRADGGLPGASAIIRGAQVVAGQALMFAGPARLVRPVLVNGAVGVLVTVDGRPVSVMGFTVTGGKISAIDALVDPDRLSQLDLAALDDER
jgi:RNA polymerase sigma-70 factor (ECF subfamily)